MQILIDVILPVFLIIGFGYGAAKLGWFPEIAVDGVMKYAQNFAVPMLLFASIGRLDLAQNFNLPLLYSFYAGALGGFLFAFLGALFIFRRPATDAVAFGFIGMFSNSLLLGLPITERAYGHEAVTWNYAIIAVHSPLIYTFGISLMEIARTRGSNLSLLRLVRQIVRTTITNPMVVGIVLGLSVNLSGVPMHQTIWAAVDMMKGSAIPAALFGLGGILMRYRPEGDIKAIGWCCIATLGVHPLITYVLASQVFDLPTGPLRSASLTASMAPGVNAFLFANMYGVAKRVAASTVLIATAISILTTWFWLNLLP